MIGTENRAVKIKRAHDLSARARCDGEMDAHHASASDWEPEAKCATSAFGRAQSSSSMSRGYTDEFRWCARSAASAAIGRGYTGARLCAFGCMPFTQIRSMF